MKKRWRDFREPREYCKKEGKIAYDKKGAITAANARYRQDHVRLRAYPCGNHWHLTAQVYEPRKRAHC